MINFGEKIVEIRNKSGGQIFTGLKTELQNREDLSTFYTPGIAEPCRRIAADKSLSKKMTVRKNTVAVVSDGSAVLGMGNIGPEAGLPVMEGKAMLFKQFADVDAVPIVLNTQDSEEIIKTVQYLAPSFGGINLEDISAPRCFEIEEKLCETLDIPVFHDDQHGTAIVVLAGLINALKIVEKSENRDIKIVISGAGAAGIAIGKLLKSYGYNNIFMTDSRGIVSCDDQQINEKKKEFCTFSKGTIADALVDADVFIGVSKPNIITAEMIKSMANDPIIFAMANPDPEILPTEAQKGGAAVVATGRSDFPNQLNNVLVFPGFFRGLLNAGVTQVRETMKLAAAEALADMVKNPTAEKIIPSPFDSGVSSVVATAIIRSAS